MKYVKITMGIISNCLNVSCETMNASVKQIGVSLSANCYFNQIDFEKGENLNTKTSPQNFENFLKNQYVSCETIKKSICSVE